MSLFSVKTKSISSGLFGTALQLLACSNIVFKHHATNNLGAVVYFYSCMTLCLKLSSQATRLMLILMMAPRVMGVAPYMFQPSASSTTPRTGVSVGGLVVRTEKKTNR